MLTQTKVSSRSDRGKTGEAVAVKFLRPEDMQNLELFRRFEDEITKLGRLNHPNIVKLVGRAHKSSIPYCATKWIDGDGLNSVVAECQLKKKGVPFERGVRWFRQMCAALKTLHEARIVHGGLTPASFWKDQTERIHLIDLGIARIDSPKSDAAKTISINVSTFDYCAPEQMSEPKVFDQRSDIYALGVIMNELLTCRRSSVHADLTSRNSTVPSWFSDLIRRMTVTVPGDRPSSVAEVLGFIEYQERMDERERSKGTVRPTEPRPDVPAVVRFVQTTWRRLQEKSKSNARYVLGVIWCVAAGGIVQLAGEYTTYGEFGGVLVLGITLLYFLVQGLVDLKSHQLNCSAVTSRHQPETAPSPQITPFPWSTFWRYPYTSHPASFWVTVGIFGIAVPASLRGLLIHLEPGYLTSASSLFAAALFLLLNYRVVPSLNGGPTDRNRILKEAVSRVVPVFLVLVITCAFLMELLREFGLDLSWQELSGTTEDRRPGLLSQIDRAGKRSERVGLWWLFHWGGACDDRNLVFVVQ
jgi:serine/threonine protein kinase